MTKDLIIVGGANGSGKTTFAKRFLALDSFYFINADEISSSQGTSNIQSGKLFFETLSVKLGEGVNVMMESTLSGKYLVGKIGEFRQAGYRISIVYLFLPSPEECIHRVKVRVQKGGHHIPDDDVRRRYYRSKSNFWNIYRKLADDWSLFYNFIGLEAVLVATGNQEGKAVESGDLYQEFIKDLK